MDHALLTVDMDVQTLRALVADQMQAIAERDTKIAQQIAVITRHERTITQHEHTITEREARITVLTAEIARLRRAQFAARSEKMDPAQRALFDVRGDHGGGHRRGGSRARSVAGAGGR